MWDLVPLPGLKLVSPALQSIFLTSHQGVLYSFPNGTLRRTYAPDLSETAGSRHPSGVCHPCHWHTSDSQSSLLLPSFWWQNQPNSNNSDLPFLPRLAAWTSISPPLSHRFDDDSPWWHRKQWPAGGAEHLPSLTPILFTPSLWVNSDTLCAPKMKYFHAALSVQTPSWHLYACSLSSSRKPISLGPFWQPLSLFSLAKMD